MSNFAHGIDEQRIVLVSRGKGDFIALPLVLRDTPAPSIP